MRCVLSFIDVLGWKVVYSLGFVSGFDIRFTHLDKLCNTKNVFMLDNNIELLIELFVLLFLLKKLGWCLCLRFQKFLRRF